MAKEVYNATYNAKDEDGNVTGSENITIEYDFGDSLQDSIDAYGEEIVHAHFKAHAAVSLQARMRAAAKAGDDPQTAVDSWKPGQVSRRGKSPVEKAMGAFEKMSGDEQAKFIEQLKEAAA